jgi:hypothetical protein
MHNGTQASVAIALPEAFACVLGTHEMDSSFEGADSNGDTQVDRWEHEPLLALAGSMGMEPASIDEALKGPDADAWKQALEYKINQLQKLRTWDIVDKPSDKPVIPCSVVLKEKCDASNNVVTRRVRIVAGGHKQMYGVDYTETFSSAAKMPSVHIVFALAAQLDWELHHVDIKSAYLWMRRCT